MAIPGIAVPGTVVPIGSLTTPGGAQGIQGPTAVSVDAGNLATLGSDSLVLVPQQTIWSARLRSFNSIGNPTFEVDQRNVGNTLTNPASGTLIIDRCRQGKIGTMGINTAQLSANTALPGTSFCITGKYLWLNLTTQQTTLGTGDQYQVVQSIEGPRMRELLLDVHSLSILASTNVVGGLKFGVTLRDNPITKCLTKLCTIPSAGVNTLITLPNLPAFAPGGNWSVTPGTVGYELLISLACGTTPTTPANDVWQNGSFIGAVGQDNFAAKPVNSTLQLYFIQHEPGALCTTPIDCPFTQNYDDCLRYFCKSFDYEVAPGTVSSLGCGDLFQQSTTSCFGVVKYPKAMAKIPTLTAYNIATGAANSIRLSNVTDYAVTGFSNIGKGGFDGITTATLPAVAAGISARLHYTADTAW